MTAPPVPTNNVPTNNVPTPDAAKPEAAKSGARPSAAEIRADAIERPPGLIRRLPTSGVAMVGIGIILFWTILAITAPWLPIDPPNKSDLASFANPGPSAAHWLGVDIKGRDILARIIWGAQRVLTVAPLAALCAYLVGCPLGLLAGYYGGKVDAVVSRAGDVILSFPIIILYVILIATIGPSILNIMLAVVLASGPGVARIVRGLTLEQRHLDYVAAAELRRESAFYIMFVELLPNCRGPLITDFCLRVGYTIITIGILGFLGLGLPPPDPDWGTMVKEGTTMISIRPHMSLFPAIAIVTLVLGFNLVADGLRELSLKD
ncbi:ABC transporter permease [Prosthecomicrobium hirschii]|uniref:ABC transporter permease n=1 Tax=Prosthecodimorpha hirschii TaxID=665126 RepID=UPI001FCDBE89|nr:ABC transporter permease [Prosthecomicrobium hirschii]MCW1839617.1 ABC transporter permease [Prosthecomicrobium hirschii]